jgi:hypothetical protein
MSTKWGLDRRLAPMNVIFREPLINVHFRHHGVRDAPKHVRPCRNAAALVLTKMLYKSELP